MLKSILKQSKPTNCTNFWRVEEDQLLIEKVIEYEGKNWKAISSFFQNRTPLSCSFRWSKIKGTQSWDFESKFTQDQDELLIYLVNKFGKEWKFIQQYFPKKSNKQIRERYLNKLRPNINKKKFTAEEDQQLYNYWIQHGKRWSLIGQLMNRSENSIKNRFYSHTIKQTKKYEDSQEKNYFEKENLEVKEEINLEQQFQLLKYFLGQTILTKINYLHLQTLIIFFQIMIINNLLKIEKFLYNFFYLKMFSIYKFIQFFIKIIFLF